MSKSIKICDSEYDAIERETQTTKRSLAGQAEHWIRIGRAIEQSDSFNYGYVKEALQGLRSPDDLSTEEQDIYFEQFCDSIMEQPHKETIKRFAELKGPVLDENNNIIQQDQ